MTDQRGTMSNTVKTRPLIVVAKRYTKESRDELIEWIRSRNGRVVHTGIGDYGEEYELEYIRINAPEGILTVSLDDWVILGPGNIFRVCKKSLFQIFYEPVHSSSQ